MSAELLPANDGYTRFLKMIERQDVASGHKQLMNKSNFSIGLQGSSEIFSLEKKSNSTNKSKTTLCPAGALTRQAQPTDEILSNELPKPESNQAIRISSLLGHGRYATPSTSVRVSDLLNAQSQRVPIQYLNASVTVSDLLRQNTLNYQIDCN